MFRSIDKSKFLGKEFCKYFPSQPTFNKIEVPLHDPYTPIASLQFRPLDPSKNISPKQFNPILHSDTRYHDEIKARMKLEELQGTAHNKSHWKSVQRIAYSPTRSTRTVHNNTTTEIESTEDLEKTREMKELLKAYGK